MQCSGVEQVALPALRVEVEFEDIEAMFSDSRRKLAGSTGNLDEEGSSNEVDITHLHAGVSTFCFLELFGTD